MSTIRENLRRGRSHLIIAGTLAIFGPIIVAIEDRELQEQAGKAPPERHGITGAIRRVSPAPAGNARLREYSNDARPGSGAPVPAPEPTQAAAPAGWEVQVGAYARERDARSHLASLRRAVPALEGVSATTERGAGYLRLRLRGYATREQAQAQCAAIREEGFDCFVPPRAR